MQVLSIFEKKYVLIYLPIHKKSKMLKSLWMAQQLKCQCSIFFPNENKNFAVSSKNKITYSLRAIQSFNLNVVPNFYSSKLQ